KAAYTAASVDGQADAVGMALAAAGVDATSITYVETDGAAIASGDPIEVTALTKLFRRSTAERAACAIGSVKTNIGDLDAAAGIAGLIKTVLALEHAELPPGRHVDTRHPPVDSASAPFYVNAALTEWRPRGARRRAGVSSFG